MKTAVIILAIIAPLWVFGQNPGTPQKTPAPAAAPYREYKVLSTADYKSLADAVQKALQDGWEPCGGVAFHPGNYGLSQAMVKRDTRAATQEK